MRWRPTVILLVDNYDSFVHNLARYVRELGEATRVCRNDAVTLREIEALGPTHIIISPGPCSPSEAGISNEVIRVFGPTVPLLGVCLGHQCISAAFGGR
jgi:para-aminobenzoate synthetase component II